MGRQKGMGNRAWDRSQKSEIIPASPCHSLTPSLSARTRKREARKEEELSEAEVLDYFSNH
jgi:hypothetical protein